MDVYLGYDEVLGVKKIIKEIKSGYKKQPNDFNVLKKLKHPGLPEINDAFECNNAMYIVIQYMDGGNLRELIETDGIYDEDRALQIVLDILHVLDYLHSIKPKPLIHGDIKPENIVLENGRAKLIDFGSVENEEGTPGFCAPERLIGIKKTIAADIYSTGEVLHYLLSGKIKKIFDSKNSEKIKSDVYNIIEKSTRKNPGERYKKSAEMSADIERVILMRQNGVPDTTSINMTCFPGNAEAACECAVVAAAQGKSVLVVDMDMLNPKADMIFGVKKCSYFLQDFISGAPSELHIECTKVKKSKNLYLLPCRTDYEGYETAGNGIVSKIAGSAAGFVDMVIFICCDFPYDQYFMDAMFLCDKIVFSVINGVPDIRKYNSMIRFVTKRQNIGKNKIFFLGFNLYKSNINSLIAAGAVEATWGGKIPFSRKRTGMYAEGNPYTKEMEKQNVRAYKRVIKKIGISGG